jgi:hypothetical protein
MSNWKLVVVHGHPRTPGGRSDKIRVDDSFDSKDGQCNVEHCNYYYYTTNISSSSKVVVAGTSIWTVHPLPSD